MINIPNEPLLFDLFYGGKGAGEESEEDLLSRMKTAIPPVTEETPASVIFIYQMSFAEVRDVRCSSTDFRKCLSVT